MLEPRLPVSFLTPLPPVQHCTCVQFTVHRVTDIVRQSGIWPGKRRMCLENIRNSSENMWLDHVNIYRLWRHRTLEVATRLEANKNNLRFYYLNGFVYRKCLRAKQNITGIGENCFVRWWRRGWGWPCSASSSPRPCSPGRRATWSWTTTANKPKVKLGKVQVKSFVVVPPGLLTVESFFIIKLKRPSISTFGVKDFSGTQGSQVLNLRIVFDEVVIN